MILRAEINPALTISSQCGQAHGFDGLCATSDQEEGPFPLPRPERAYLGIMYRKGQGVPQDAAAAVKWFRLAADRGDVEAQYNLGIMYSNGEGVPQDYVVAHKWFTLAAAQGNEGAREIRDLVVTKMTLAQIAEAQKLAREWRPK